MAREEEINVERNWREAERATIERSLALASLENECRQKLTEATYRYNQALVSATINSFINRTTTSE